MAGLVTLFAIAAVVLGTVALAVRWPDLPDTRAGQGAQMSRRTARIGATVLMVLAAIVGLVYWIRWALWSNQMPRGAAPVDRWLNVVLGLGAVATVAGVA